MSELGMLSQAVDRRTNPVTVFFRDDDAGWANDRLDALCKLFSRLGAPLDLAVIPGALDRTTATELIRIVRKHGSLLGLHQHGYTHTNHQESGRKGEFGDARSRSEKTQDIRLGQQRLRDVFGELTDPIFTPPWNRCAAETCEILRELDFAALSRIERSAKIDHCGLADISVSIDWQKKKSGVPLTWGGFCSYASKRLQHEDVVGVMLHHEHLPDNELKRLSSFIERLQASTKVNFKSMLQVLESSTIRIRSESNGRD